MGQYEFHACREYNGFFVKFVLMMPRLFQLLVGVALNLFGPSAQAARHT